MSERSFVNSNRNRLAEEIEHRTASDNLKAVCIELIQEYAHLTDARVFDKPILDMPVVKWSDDGSDLLTLILEDDGYMEITTDHLFNRTPETFFETVKNVLVTFYPKEESHIDGGLITVAYLQLWNGPDGTAVITDIDGSTLDTEELNDLRCDFERYRELIAQGKLEEIPHKP